MTLCPVQLQTYPGLQFSLHSVGHPIGDVDMSPRLTVSPMRFASEGVSGVIALSNVDFCQHAPLTWSTHRQFGPSLTEIPPETSDSYLVEFAKTTVQLQNGPRMKIKNINPKNVRF